MTKREKNLQTQNQFRDAVNSGNLEDLHNVISTDVKDHDPAEIQGKGAQGFIDFFSMMRSAFPDLHVHFEEVIADDTYVNFAYTVSGTHKGEFMGLKPTNKSFEVRGVQITKFNDDAKVIERWGSTDELGLLKQLGVQPI